MCGSDITLARGPAWPNARIGGCVASPWKIALAPSLRRSLVTAAADKFPSPIDLLQPGLRPSPHGNVRGRHASGTLGASMTLFKQRRAKCRSSRVTFLFWYARSCVRSNPLHGGRIRLLRPANVNREPATRRSGR